MKKFIKFVVCMCLQPIFPLKKNKIVFINFNGKGFGCNPKYIAKELLKAKQKLDIVWLISDMDETLPDGIRKVKYGSHRAQYELYTAGVWISNVRNYQGVNKRKKQLYIQTWHAPYSYKPLEKEAVKSIGKRLEVESKYDGKITDYFLSNSKIQSEDIRANFWYDGIILECGYPRNDIFFVEKKEEIVENIKNKLNINADKKVVLYAPTFRDIGTVPFVTNFDNISKAVTNLYNESCVILLRLHPNDIDKMKDSLVIADNLLDVCTYPDMQELLLVADMLVTDYSTSPLDFIIQEKDVILYVPDLQEYSETRGLKKGFFDIPFPMALNEEQLVDIISKYDIEKQRKKNKEYYNSFSSFDKGNASKEVCKIIMEYIGS